MTTSAIPIGDAAPLRHPRNRTRIVRLTLAAAMLGAVIAALLLAGLPALNPAPLLSTRSNGIIVVDLSASSDNGEFALMYANLKRLAGTKDRFGLVLFSDQAYEALPPGTPSTLLVQLASFFHPTNPPPNNPALPTPSGGVIVNQTSAPTYPANPWASGFTLGTTISAGLSLAASILLGDPASERSVWLLSDLGDNPPDFPVVATVAKDYAHDGITLHVLGIDPTKANARFFAGLVGPSGVLVTPAAAVPPPTSSNEHFPLWLAIVTALLALLLAANEIWSSPLRWGSLTTEGRAGV